MQSLRGLVVGYIFHNSEVVFKKVITVVAAYSIIS